MSIIRQNFHSDSEALINKQINLELTASYVYLSMVSKFTETCHQFLQNTKVTVNIGLRS